MPKLSEKGAIQFIVLLILLAGIVGAVLLVTRGEPLKLLPRATVSGPISPQTSMSLTYWPTDIYPGRFFAVHLRVRSDIDKANLFVGRFTFDPNVLEVESISTDFFLQNIVEKHFDNQVGTVSVAGGVPNPGFSTTVGSEDPIMAQIMVRVKPTAASGSTTRLEFSDDSAVYRNSDNVNILGPKNGVTITIGSTTSPTPVPGVVLTVSPGTVSVSGTINFTWSGVPNPAIGDYIFVYDSNNVRLDSPRFWTNNCTRLSSDPPRASGTCSNMPIPSAPGTYYMKLFSNINNELLATSNNFTVVSASPSPTPTATPVATPIPGTGDGNRDGKINLADMSVLLTDFNKESRFRVNIDMNGDGKINTFDFSLMRNLLIEKKVIKG